MPLDVSVGTYQRSQVEPYVANSGIPFNVNLVASTSFPAGTVLGELTATPGTYAPYLSTNTDGSQVPKAVLSFQCYTDASGNIYRGSAAQSEFGESWKADKAYFGGIFLTTDLVGLDANAVTAFGRIMKGTLASGIVNIR